MLAPLSQVSGILGTKGPGRRGTEGCLGPLRKDGTASLPPSWGPRGHRYGEEHVQTWLRTGAAPGVREQSARVPHQRQ